MTIGSSRASALSTISQWIRQLPLENSNKESAKCFSAVIPVPLWRNLSLTLSGFIGTHQKSGK